MLSPDELVRQRRAAHRLALRPLISIITPVYNTPPQALRRMLSSIKHQTYPFWELCLVDDASSDAWIAPLLEREAAADPRMRFRRRAQNGGIATASNDALALATGEFAAFIDHDDEVEPQALYEVARAINERPDVDVLHTDFDSIDENGLRAAPTFWPDWSPERLETLPYTVHLRVHRRSCIEAVGGLRAALDGAQDYDLALRLAERTDKVVHIPQVLYHWRTGGTSAAGNLDAKPYAYEAGIRALSEHLARSGTPAERAPGPGPGLHRLRFDGAVLPPVSIVAAVDAAADGGPNNASAEADRPLQVLAASLAGLVARADVAVGEIVVVAPGDAQGAVRSALRCLPADRLRVVTWPAGPDAPADPAGIGDTGGPGGARPGDHAAALNAGARQATGELLMFLGEALEPAGDEYLSQLAGYAQRSAVGAVGPLVYDPSGQIAHAGIVFPRGRPLPVRRIEPEEEIGFFFATRLVSNYSAVSGACLMTRRSVFEEVGGFRPAAEVGYSAVDYCLRLRSHGYRIVYTGFAELRQLQPQPPVPADLEQARLAAFSRHWPSLPAVDPYYNPSFNQEHGAFHLGDP
jgi:GT2 family glycosyltransferase